MFSHPRNRHYHHIKRKTNTNADFRHHLHRNKRQVEFVHAEEVDADDLAGSIESDIDFIKALKIKEARLLRKLKEVKKTKLRVRNRLTKRI